MEFSRRVCGSGEGGAEFSHQKLALTPYAYAEAFYDWRYDVWHRFRYAAGAEWELNRRVVLEGYYLRQRDRRLVATLYPVVASVLFCARARVAERSRTNERRRNTGLPGIRWDG